MAGKEYQMAFSIGAKLQGQFNAAFKGAQTSVTQLQNAITSLNKQQGDIAAYQKQQKAVEQTRAKLQMLQQQYANLKSSMGENGEASVDLKNKMLQKELQIQRTTERLESQEAALNNTGNALREAGVDTNSLTTASEQLSTEISELKAQQEELAEATDTSGQSMESAASSVAEFASAIGLMAILKTAADALKACTEEAIAFENSMAAVKRTVGGSDAFINNLAASFKNLSTEIPITTADLTEIASTAGQLGIAQDDVESFTTVMAKLATTTDLGANEAATMLAQFANITGIRSYDRLGAVIAELGDSTATTASKVVEMSQGMAASASQAGMSATDIMAISAALGSLGIEAQAGSTSMSQLISTLYKATETGEKLEEFASVAGMTADQFKRAWAEDAVSAMNAFIQGLTDTERNGRSAIVILDELGITNVRQTKAILGLASAGGLLASTVSQANSAWASNTALNEKAAIMYETTQAKLTMLSNAFSNLKIAVGDAFTPSVASAADGLKGIIEPVTAFIEQNPSLVRAITITGTVIGGVTAALLAYTAAAKVAKIASMALMTAIPGAKTIIGITLAVAALAGIVTVLVDACKGGQRSMEELNDEFDTLNEEIAEQDRVQDLIKRYRNLQKELNDTSSEVKNLNFDDVDIELSATAKADLTPEDFMLPNAEGITLTAGQEATLLEAGFLNPDDDGVTITAGQMATLLESGFLNPDDEGITLTAEQTASLLERGFLNPEDEGITLTAEQTKNLLETGFLSPDDNGITLTAEQTKNLLESGFLNPDDEGIWIAANQTKDLLESGFLNPDDEGITLTAEQTKNLLESGFLDPNDKGITLTAEQTASLLASGFLNPQDQGITLTAEQTANLLESGFLNPEDEGIKLSAEQTATLLANGFLNPEDEGITLTAEQTANLLAAGFLNPEDGGITLTAEQTAVLLASGFLNPNDPGIKLTAEAMKELDAEDFVKNPNLAFNATIDNLPELQEAANSLSQKASSIKSDYSTALTNLNTMKQRYEELEARLYHASTEAEKSKIRTEMESLLQTITEQEEEVGNLETAYQEADAQYQLVAATAADLAAKEAELADIKNQIAEATDGMIPSIAAENMAYEDQLELLETIAAAKKAELQSKVFTNIQEQSSYFARAYRQAEQLNWMYSANAKTLQYMSTYINNPDGLSHGLLQAYFKLSDLVSTGFRGQIGADIVNSDAMREVEALMYLLTGENKHFSYASTLSDIFNIIMSVTDGTTASTETMLAAQAEVSERASAQAKAYAEQNAIVQEFIDNIVLGVTQGDIALETMETLLLSSIDDADMVAYIMSEVQRRTEGAADGTEELADGMENAAESAATVPPEIQNIIDQMNLLGDAYQAAYDEAYNSMDGQFKLFEKTPELTEESVDDMIAALQNQQQYMQDYVANLKAAKEMGLSKGLIAQLSDGSAESAAYLDAIVKAGEEKVDELNTAFAGVEAGKQEFAGTVADMETDFAAKMADMQAQLETTIAEMDMSTEAAQAGADTIQAFADAAAGKASSVKTAFKAIRDAAIDALMLRFHLDGYASGTDSAAPGFAWVGENGPELMAFSGGEKVWNASESRAILADSFRGGNTSISVSPVYNITGGDPDTLRGVLGDQTQALRGMIEDVLSDIASDRERSVYA